MEKIAQIMVKLKVFLHAIERNDVFVILLIILVGSGSFALGRLSSANAGESPITIENVQFGASIGSQGAENRASGQNVVNQSGEVVASINGSKYHFPWCSGAQRMNEENKIWFNTIADAKKAGYEPAKNCKGLE